MKKKAFITGITGQDGSYLTEFLLKKDYEVHGMVRRSSSFNRERLTSVYRDLSDKHKDLHLHYGDLLDSANIISLVKQTSPDEIYNLGAQSHVKISSEIPIFTSNVDGLGPLKVMEAVKLLGLDETKIYQASTSELYGEVLETPQTEKTPFNPKSPYGIAKQYAFAMAQHYREAYDMFISNGILFNHESPRRGENFVTRKIARGLCEINAGVRDKIHLGNIHASRDWGYAKDYVESMWMMLQQEQADDYVIATGETHSVKEFVDACSNYLGEDMQWEGEGLDEKGINPRTGKEIVVIDQRYFRPVDVEFLQGDASKAKEKLGWEPRTSFKDLVKIMVDAESAMVCSL